MKFSIRDILLVTVIVAVGAGWLVDHNASNQLRSDCLELRRENATLKWKLDSLLVLLDPEFVVEFTDKNVSLVRRTDNPSHWKSSELAWPSPSQLKAQISASAKPKPKPLRGVPKRELQPK